MKIDCTLKANAVPTTLTCRDRNNGPISVLELLLIDMGEVEINKDIINNYDRGTTIWELTAIPFGNSDKSQLKPRPLPIDIIIGDTPEGFESSKVTDFYDIISRRTYIIHMHKPPFSYFWLIRKDDTKLRQIEGPIVQGYY